MLTRIRIEAAAQTVDDVTHDLWSVCYAVAEALVGDGQPIINPSIQEEVITRLDDSERTDAHVYKGRLVVGFPIDWSHAKGWFEMWAAKHGVVLPDHGALSPMERDRIIEEHEATLEPSVAASKASGTQAEAITWGE